MIDMYLSVLIRNEKVKHIAMTPRRYLGRDIVIIDGFAHTFRQWKNKGYHVEYIGYKKI